MWKAGTRTAWAKWNKEVNKVEMECFYRVKPFTEERKPIKGIQKENV